MIISIFFLALFGLIVSLYLYRLEKKLQKNRSYKPSCDISDKISCSKAVLSGYGQLFGFSNALMGCFFYATIAILAFLHQTTVLFYLSLFSLFASFFFAYILYFKIKTVCILCTTVYLINLLIFLLIYNYH